MCGATVVYYKCGHYGSVTLKFCGDDPRPQTDHKETMRLGSLGYIKELEMEYQTWCGFTSETYVSASSALHTRIYTPRLCDLCREVKRKEAREMSADDPDYDKRYDWRSQREARPTCQQLQDKEASNGYDWSKCSKPWKDPLSESDKSWQQAEDIDEDTWRQKRNEIVGGWWEEGL